MSARQPFAAALLAGGRSRRMGRDKALLPLANGTLLWQRQLALLESLVPAELFISGHEREGFPPSIPRIEDETPDLGPLAGIAALLRVIRSPRLLVLAVDLPMMTTTFLLELLSCGDHVSGECGVIPRTSAGLLEPLAAIYPRPALAVAEGHLRDDDRSMQRFARGLLQSGAAVECPVDAADAGLFTNWNSPADVQIER